MSRVYAIKCFLRNEFHPAYEKYSSFDVVTVLTILEECAIQDKALLQSRLASYLEDSYENADGILKTSHLFFIGGIQDSFGEIDLLTPIVEIYRDFYIFNRSMTGEEFLNSYYFDDIENNVS